MYNFDRNSNSLSLSRNSVSSSYEDLQACNIHRPHNADFRNGRTDDDETFTKLVFNNQDTKVHIFKLRIFTEATLNKHV